MPKPTDRLYFRQKQIYYLEHPDYPRHLSITVPVIRNADTANGLQRFISEWCKSYGYFAKRVNVTGIVRNGKFTRSGATSGFSDMQFNVRTANGIVPVYCEVKIGKDTQNEAQQEFQARCDRTGIEQYIIVHTAEQFLQWWDQTGVIDNYAPPRPVTAELPGHVELTDQVVRSRPVRVASDQKLAAVLKFQQLDRDDNNQPA